MKNQKTNAKTAAVFSPQVGLFGQSLAPSVLKSSPVAAMRFRLLNMVIIMNNGR